MKSNPAPYSALGVPIGTAVIAFIMLAELLAVPWAIVTGLLTVFGPLDWTWVGILLPLIISTGILVIISIIGTIMLIHAMFTQ